jgi:hypothetical protein
MGEQGADQDSGGGGDINCSILLTDNTRENHQKTELAAGNRELVCGDNDDRLAQSMSFLEI